MAEIIEASTEQSLPIFEARTREAGNNSLLLSGHRPERNLHNKQMKNFRKLRPQTGVTAASIAGCDAVFFSVRGEEEPVSERLPWQTSRNQ